MQATHVDEVRRQAEGALRALLAETAGHPDVLPMCGAGSLRESILIHNGFYWGRRFWLAGLEARYDAEQSTLALYDSSGALCHRLCVSASDDAGQPLPRAA